MRAEFDRHADSYEAAIGEAISFAGRGHGFYLDAKAQVLSELAKRRLGSGPLRALDVGCGPGLLDRRLSSRFELSGVDVAPEMVERARAANPGVDYAVSSAAHIPHADEAFDLAFAACVLHHVERPDRSRLVKEMRRVVRSGGLVVVFEHNPLNPLTRRVVRSCAFDRDASLIFRRQVEALCSAAGLGDVETHYLLFVPLRSRLAQRAERMLRRVPLGAQYVVAGRRP